MKNHTLLYYIAVAASVVLATASCKNKPKTDAPTLPRAVETSFNADSAWAFCNAQCDFGPRTMNSEAHEKCLQWITGKFKTYNCEVKQQKAELTGYDGTKLNATNIIASFRPELTTRIMLCAHYDSRPWADNDPNPANHHTPVMAANDGASGVAVMLEVARMLNNAAKSDTLSVGVDFVCFDAEDWGTPQWAEDNNDGDTWALGAQYFAANLPEGYEARYAILLDMVGGEGAQFHREGMSVKYANAIVNKVWEAAKAASYGSYFPDSEGGYVTDDHIPLNQVAGIAAIDIIPFYADCQQSSFGPTWHTVNDDMSHIDRTTLKAVGQTMLQVILSER